ncbi:NAD(P)H-dependent oxidoreductase [Vibrio kyushuensis]|uniref:NAD(P)H-dependent oxidoreductase n=1 Tax=Vibrio kyushuensis TaxID=2910249 RepID=UPI003D141850
MNNILLINAKQPFGHSQGEYTNGLFEAAHDLFIQNGWNVESTTIEQGYDVEAELTKLDKADLIISHTPLWWMGLPWTFKKYMDDVFTAGHGILFQNDGRTRSDQGKLYGSGGIKTSTKYMLTMVMNAPESAFSDSEKDGLFEGADIDQAMMQFHKTFQFLGMKPATTFTANDVMKVPQFEKHKAEYLTHLCKEFGLKQDNI